MIEESSPLGTITRNLMQMLACNEAVDSTVLSPTESFDDMGFDSITLVELAIQIENAYQIKVSAGDLAACENVDGIAKNLLERLTFDYVQ